MSLFISFGMLTWSSFNSTCVVIVVVNMPGSVWLSLAPLKLCSQMVLYKLDYCANFLEKFMSSDNSICMAFKRHAVIGVNWIYSTYSNIHWVPELRHVIDELFTHRQSSGFALDITPMLLLYYYLIWLYIYYLKLIGCYLHMLCFFLCCFCVSAFLANKNIYYIIIINKT